MQIAISILIACGLLLACEPETTGPSERTGHTSTALNQVTPEASRLALLAYPPDFSDQIADIVERLLPGFENLGTSHALKMTLTHIGQSASAADYAGAAKAVETARNLLRQGASNPAELDAIRSTLDVIYREIKREESQRRSS